MPSYSNLLPLLRTKITDLQSQNILKRQRKCCRLAHIHNIFINLLSLPHELICTSLIHSRMHTDPFISHKTVQPNQNIFRFLFPSYHDKSSILWSLLLFCYLCTYPFCFLNSISPPKDLYKYEWRNWISSLLHSNS